MPVPEQYLSEHPALLCGIAVSLFLVNNLLYVQADRGRSRVPSIELAPMLPLRARLLRPLLGAVVFLTLALLFEGPYRAFFGGAFLVMQIAGLSMLVGNLLTTAALRRPDAARGTVAYSAPAQARLMAASLVSSSVLCLGATALLASPGFFGAAIFLAATAVGYHRRARHHARAAGQPLAGNPA
jgi:hypothetical protein